MNEKLKNKTIWLTGASSGIGEALAKQLATIDCKLVISARRAEVLQELSDALSPCAAEVCVAPLDITEKQQLTSQFEQIIERVGPIDLLIANAGTHIPTQVEVFDSEQYDFLMQVNYSGALRCLELVLPSMIERRSGHIVGVSSVAGYRGLPRAAAYGASKAALTHFLESLRFDLIKHNVDVTIVNPGFVRTPLTDKNEFPMPFRIEASEAAEIILRGIEQVKKEVHFPWQFSWLMKCMRIIPFSWYHKIIVAKVLPK